MFMDQQAFQVHEPQVLQGSPLVCNGWKGLPSRGEVQEPPEPIAEESVSPLTSQCEGAADNQVLKQTNNIVFEKSHSVQ